MPSKPAGKKDNRFTVNLSDDLLAIERELCRRERYRSHTEAYESFLHHWALSQQDHALTGGWASLSPEDRTALDADLRQLDETGKGKKGCWLKAVIYGCIKELNGKDANSPTVDQDFQRLPESIRTSHEATHGTANSASASPASYGTPTAPLPVSPNSPASASSSVDSSLTSDFTGRATATP